MSCLVEVVNGCSDGSIVVGMPRIAVTRVKYCTILSNAFLVVSPASRLIVVVEDRLVKIDILSKVACFEKSSVFISVNGTTLDMKVTVSASLHVLVYGKVYTSIVIY